jgi:hypothetical protein
VSQTKKGSAIETVASTAIGFGVSYVANIIILPLYGYQVTHGDAFGMSIIFTVLSLIRGFYVRRMFNSIKRHHIQHQHPEVHP